MPKNPKRDSSGYYIVTEATGKGDEISKDQQHQQQEEETNIIENFYTTVIKVIYDKHELITKNILKYAIYPFFSGLLAASQSFLIGYLKRARKHDRY